MANDDPSLFQDEVFKKNLSLYEQMLKGGQAVYLEADELTDIAEYYWLHNKEEKAMACVDYALKLHPDGVDPLIFLARQKMFAGQIDEAFHIRNSISDPYDNEVIFFDAEMMLRFGNLIQAANYLSEMAELEEDDDPAYFAYDAATLFLDYGHLELASKWCERALDMEPDNEKFLVLKSDIFIGKDQPNEAIDLLNAILDDNPYNLAAWHSLGEAYFLLDDYAKINEAADFALAIDEDDAQGLLLKANCYFQLQNYEEAHLWYTRYINNHYSNEMPYLFDGSSLLSLGRPQEALPLLLKAEKISCGASPEQSHIYVNLSEAYSELRQLDKAFAYIDKIKEMDPGYAYGDMAKGHILMQNGKKDEAMKFFESFISSYDLPFEAHLLVGLELVENGAYEEARSHFMYVLAHEQQAGESGQKVHAFLAYCALMQNRYDDFVAFLKVACQKDAEALESTVGKFIPDEVNVKDFYYYVVTHSDLFRNFNPDRPIQ